MITPTVDKDVGEKYYHNLQMGINRYTLSLAFTIVSHLNTILHFHSTYMKRESDTCAKTYLYDCSIIIKPETF